MNKPKVVPAEFLGWCRICLDVQVTHWLPWQLMVYSTLECKGKLWDARAEYWLTVVLIVLTSLIIDDSGTQSSLNIRVRCTINFFCCLRTCRSHNAVASPCNKCVRYDSQIDVYETSCCWQQVLKRETWIRQTSPVHWCSDLFLK